MNSSGVRVKCPSSSGFAFEGHQMQFIEFHLAPYLRKSLYDD